MNMPLGLKRHWRQLREGKPGQRFEDRYERKQEEREDRGLILSCLQPALALMLIAIGLVFCLIPGPGIPLILIGTMLLAERSRALARILDWLEVKSRRILHRGKSSWRKSSPFAKNALILLVTSVIAGAGYGAYQIVFAR
jgi:hypothetical protein